MTTSTSTNNNDGIPSVRKVRPTISYEKKRVLGDTRARCIYITYYTCAQSLARIRTATANRSGGDARASCHSARLDAATVSVSLSFFFFLFPALSHSIFLLLLCTLPSLSLSLSLSSMWVCACIISLVYSLSFLFFSTTYTYTGCPSRKRFLF